MIGGAVRGLRGLFPAREENPSYCNLEREPTTKRITAPIEREHVNIDKARYSVWRFCGLRANAFLQSHALT